MAGSIEIENSDIPFIVYSYRRSAIAYPVGLLSGEIRLNQTEQANLAYDSFILSGGYRKSHSADETLSKVLQTGIVTALGPIGAGFCERALSNLATNNRVMILYPEWGAIAKGWSENMRQHGFSIAETVSGARYDLAVGRGENLVGCQWMSDLFYGISALVVITKDEPSRFENDIRNALMSGIDIREYIRQFASDLNNEPSRWQELIGDVDLCVSWGGPDINNMSLIMRADDKDTCSVMKGCLIKAAAESNVELYNAGAILTSHMDSREYVEFPSFLTWIDVPITWNRLV